MLEHQTPLIATIAAGLVMAYGFGLLAHRLRIQPLVGYLVAGIAVGPFTPGFVADPEMASQLAEIGVILLMFGVGLHFSLKDLAAIGRLVVPGAVGQILFATALGLGLALSFGWQWQAGIIFGLALSVASTVVLIRALQERRILETESGHIAVGWVVVEDLVMVVALVLIPVLQSFQDPSAIATSAILVSLAITLAKIAAFIVLMLVVGTRVIPLVMHHTAHTGSRELFRLSVYATALGVAYFSATLFDASFALGAFVAGIVMGESKLSQRAAEEAMPLRDAFAVLFFVSVGMLFNPLIIIEQPLAVLATLSIILFGKTLVGYGLVRAFGRGHATALHVSVSLAQIGEFSFILAGIGVTSGLLPVEGRDLILSGAILSILLNPAMMYAAQRWDGKIVPVAAPQAQSLPTTPAAQHAILVGFGRTGSLLADALRKQQQRVVVIEIDETLIELAEAKGIEVIQGNAAEPEVLQMADVAAAQRLFVTIPDPFEAGQVVEQARAINGELDILALAETEEAAQHLSAHGASMTILGEDEIARRMAERGLAVK